MMVSRLAPTPNGEIHFGNLMNFILTWSYVKQHNGTLLLRFDDIDEQRCQPIYASHTKEVLKYIGLTYEREYSHQLLRKDHYFNFLKQLPHYVCECSRLDIIKRTGDYHYDGFCRNKKIAFIKDQTSIRFQSHDERLDFVIWRKEDLPSYHLTSVKDDLDYGVNTVIRGEDLIESTKMQQQMLAAINNNSIQFVHHRLITDKDGNKLSKSRQDGDLIHSIRNHIPPVQMLRSLCRLMGLEPSKFNSLTDFEDLRLEDYLV